MALINKDKLVLVVDSLIDKIMKNIEESELFSSIDPKQTEKWKNGFYVERLEDAKGMYEAYEHTYVDEEVQNILFLLGNKYDNEDLFLARQLLMKKNIELYETIIKNISSDYYLNKDRNTNEDTNKKRLARLEEAKLKDIIDVKDFELLFSYSESTQKSYRARLNNPLPYQQEKFGSKIQYNKKEVSRWLEDINSIK